MQAKQTNSYWSQLSSHLWEGVKFVVHDVCAALLSVLKKPR